MVQLLFNLLLAILLAYLIRRMDKPRINEIKSSRTGLNKDPIYSGTRFMKPRKGTIIYPAKVYIGEPEYKNSTLLWKSNYDTQN